MCSPVQKKFKNPCFISINYRYLFTLFTLQRRRNFTLQWWRNFFNEFAFLLDPINMLGKNLYLGGCTYSWWIQWAKNQLHKPLHSKVIMDNVSVCIMFSWCLLYIVIYSHVLLYLPYHYFITNEAETVPVHSSVPANNEETTKRILINVCTPMVL